MSFSAKLKDELAHVICKKSCCNRAKTHAAMLLSGKPLNAEQQMPNSCCLSSFFREVFLRCGSVSDPEKAYRVEFYLHSEEIAETLADLIESSVLLSFRPKHTRRGENHILYIKGNGRVGDFLAFIGAASGMMEILQSAMVREVRNNINRRINFETANMGKTAAASKNQIEAVKKVRSQYCEDNFSGKEQQLMQLRLDNPDFSLRELGYAMTPPVTRSTVNRILQKILNLARDEK